MNSPSLERITKQFILKRYGVKIRRQVYQFLKTDTRSKNWMRVERKDASKYTYMISNMIASGLKFWPLFNNPDNFRDGTYKTDEIINLFQNMYPTALNEYFVFYKKKHLYQIF